MSSIILRTERLVFREMDNGDLDFLGSMLDDSETMQHYDKPFSRADAPAWLDKVVKRQQDDGHSFWLMANRESGEPIGQMGLLKQHVEGVDEMELGYMLHRSHWRQGFAAEGARAVRDLAFREFECQRLISLIRPSNIASQRVALSYGAKPERLVVWREIEHLVFALARTDS